MVGYLRVHYPMIFQEVEHYANIDMGINNPQGERTNINGEDPQQNTGAEPGVIDRVQALLTPLDLPDYVVLDDPIVTVPDSTVQEVPVVLPNTFDLPFVNNELINAWLDDTPEISSFVDEVLNNLSITADTDELYGLSPEVNELNVSTTSTIFEDLDIIFSNIDDVF